MSVPCRFVFQLRAYRCIALNRRCGGPLGFLGHCQKISKLSLGDVARPSRLSFACLFFWIGTVIVIAYPEPEVCVSSGT